jgi:hypothetical protein
MAKQEVTEALAAITTSQELTDYLFGLPEGELETLPLAPIEEWAKKFRFDLKVGELNVLLTPLFAASKKRLRFVRIGNIVNNPIKWLVKGILELGAFGMFFGDSGTYKSFISIALAACIATGCDFYGHPVKKGAVYYIAAEGNKGIKRRFDAWAQENSQNLTDAPLHLNDGAVNLLHAANEVNSALEDAVKKETELPVLVVIDTWSRSLGSDDSDTAAASEGLSILDKIRMQFPGLAILIIHHTGLKEKKRARGAYLIHAALDSEFRLEKENGKIIFTNTKSKESELLPPMAFKARKVKLIGDDGRYLLDESKEIGTSIVLERIDYVAPTSESKGLGTNQKMIYEVLDKSEKKRMKAEDLLATVQTKFKMKKDTFDKAIKGLEERGLLYREEGFLCLGKRPKF